jgi:hypothetical protein
VLSLFFGASRNLGHGPQKGSRHSGVAELLQAWLGSRRYARVASVW